MAAALMDVEVQPLQGLDILVLEEDADAREMLTLVLTDRGASVRVAEDYASVLAQVQARWAQVIISDIGLPGRDGHERMRSVRALQAEQSAPTPRLPAVALTAFARAEDREKRHCWLDLISTLRSR